MSEDGGIMWDHHRIEQKMRRRERLPRRTAQIWSLKKMGYSVKQMTEYQFRIKGRVDVFPIHNRYHDIKTNERGGYRDVVEFVRNYFNKLFMQNTKHLIAGYGEVGKGLHEVLKYAQVLIQDQDKGCDQEQTKVDVLHVCFPYSEQFADLVKRYQEKFEPNITIVHSTVPVGTCDALEVVHSPIRGVHPNLAEGIKTFTKYFGGKGSYEAAMLFAKMGIGVMYFDKASITEAIKLWDTTQYGWMIILEKMIYDWCKAQGFTDQEAWDIYGQANNDYNKGYWILGRKDVQRPLLKHVGGPIGGHCVLPNLELLDSEICGVIKLLHKRYETDRKQTEASQEKGQ